MSLSDLLDATHPPLRLADLHPGTLHVDGQQAPCHIGLLTSRVRLDYFARWYPGMDVRPGPERFSSMWTSGADHLVDALPVRDDGLWWRTVHAAAVEWHGDRGEVFTGDALLVDRPRTYAEGVLEAATYREVWIIGDWSITLPEELSKAWRGAPVPS